MLTLSVLLHINTEYIGLKLGRVELTENLFQIHWVVSVYLHITAPLIVACSFDLWKAYKKVGGTSMHLNKILVNSTRPDFKFIVGVRHSIH